MNPKVSVVIPVYKTEQYIDECVKSILDQDYDNLEIILVDDGSPDGCPQICDDYADKDSRIKVVHKENSGLGLSRNAGVDASSGEYVTFVDSDDKLDGTTAVSEMVDAALKSDADLVVGCFRRFDDDYISEINNHHLINGEDTDSLDFRFRGFFQYGHLAYDWGKLYKKSFMEENGLKRGSYPFTQDKAFNMQFYACNPKYCFIDSSVYCYRVNLNSVTFKHKDNFIPVWTSISSDFIKYLKENRDRRKKYDLPAFHVYFGSFFLVKQELQAEKSLRETADILKEYAKVPCVNKLMKAIIAKEYTKGIKTKSWRWMIWFSTLLFDLHLYRIFVFGIAVLRKLGIDGGITKRRYQKK